MNIKFIVIIGMIILAGYILFDHYVDHDIKNNLYTAKIRLVKQANQSILVNQSILINQSVLVDQTKNKVHNEIKQIGPTITELPKKQITNTIELIPNATPCDTEKSCMNIIEKDPCSITDIPETILNKKLLKFAKKIAKNKGLDIKKC